MCSSIGTAAARPDRLEQSAGSLRCLVADDVRTPSASPHLRSPVPDARNAMKSCLRPSQSRKATHGCTGASPFMHHLVRIAGAIFTALTISVGLVVGLGHTQPIRPSLIDHADQNSFTCAATSLDCGYEPGYFTIIDPAHHAWQRAGAARPSLVQLVLALGA